MKTFINLWKMYAKTKGCYLGFKQAWKIWTRGY